MGSSDNRRGLDCGRFDTAFQLDDLFDQCREPLKDQIEDRTRFTRLDHVAKQTVKNFGVFFEGRK